MHQFRFGIWPKPAQGVLPDPLAGFKGPISNGKEERGRKKGVIKERENGRYYAAL